MRRTNLRAKAEHADPVSGATSDTPRPGTRPTGRMVARVRTPAGIARVAVSEREIDPEDTSVRVRPEAEAAIKGRAKPAQRSTRKRARKRPTTFRSARDAAQQFAHDNEAFFDGAAARDPRDAVVDFIRRVSVGSGRKGRRQPRLSDTPRGKDLIEAWSQPSFSAAVDTLTYLFGLARGRKWDAVPWGLVREFEDALREVWPDGPAIAYPVSTGRISAAEASALAEQDPESAAVSIVEENRLRLLDEIDELERLAAAANRLMPTAERRAVKRRIRDLRALAATPERIAESFACESQGLTSICEFPGIEDQKAELRAYTAPPEDLDLPWENPKRPPITIRDGDEATDLDGARVLEVAAGGYVHRWTDGPTLLWFPRARALVWYQGGIRRSAARPHDGTGKAANVARRWTWRGGGGEAAYDLSVVRPRGAWRDLGPADRVDYSSSKDGRRHAYTHEHDRGVRLYRLGGERPPWMWALKGGKLKISKGGIEG